MKIIDQIGREILLKQSPVRIVSMVPSITELLFDLGLEEEIVGITRYCILPKEKVKNATKIGGTKDFDLEQIVQLKADFFFANKEENPKEKIETLQQHVPVYVSDVQNLEQALSMIGDIGEITGKTNKANAMVEAIRAQFNHKPEKMHSAIYLIWNNPMMTIGGDTFISNMMLQAGFENMYNNSTRYPTISEEDIIALSPAYLLLSSEPFRFTQSHRNYFNKLLPNTTILLVDGKIFSWYGSHLNNCLPYFNKLKMHKVD
ncbi:MAG: ABC transporter substrate-binding protein [Bacteroidetes bacterium]|nr:ABC transporter substrate-binding protein [Bacteroidota bacterium]